MDALDRLLAIEGVRQCKAKYAYCVDTKDWDGFGSLFTDDAVFDETNAMTARHPKTGEWVRTGSEFSLELLQSVENGVAWPVIGAKNIVEVARGMAEYNLLVHKLFNPTIEILTELTAKAIWPFEDEVYFSEGQPMRYMNGMGHYHETYEKKGDNWLIKTMTLTRTLVRAR
ncbi:nuclear transport factor 2 family protein [Rhizorhabdus argentea]|uniref:nuclear transport factor 2 family protein n=1 Tax=Rhizorhabdus argentea TaxID=1387174 RepID=UPI0030EC13BC